MPSEPLVLKCSQIIPPSRGPSSCRLETVVLNPVEDARSTKTHDYDDSPLCDRPVLPQLGPALLRRARCRPRGDPLLSVCQADVARDLRDACRRLRFRPPLEVVKHKPRHGKVPTDFAGKLRRLA